MTGSPLLRALRRAPLGLALVLRCSLAMAGQAPGAGSAPDFPARRREQRHAPNDLAAPAPAARRAAS